MMIRNWVLGLVLGVVWMAAQDVRADDLSRREEKRALFAIDQICADTWCEGDYNFRFRDLICNFTLGSCVLKYQTSPWPSREGQKVSWSNPFTCVIRNISNFDQLITVRGRQDDLNSDPYEQITECINFH